MDDEEIDADNDVEMSMPKDKPELLSFQMDSNVAGVDNSMTQMGTRKNTAANEIQDTTHVYSTNQN